MNLADPERAPALVATRLLTAGWTPDDGRVNWTCPKTGWLHSWPAAELLSRDAATPVVDLVAVEGMGKGRAGRRKRDAEVVFAV